MNYYQPTLHKNQMTKDNYNMAKTWNLAMEVLSMQ